MILEKKQEQKENKDLTGESTVSENSETHVEKESSTSDDNLTSDEQTAVICIGNQEGFSGDKAIYINLRYIDASVNSFMELSRTKSKIVLLDEDAECYYTEWQHFFDKLFDIARMTYDNALDMNLIKITQLEEPDFDQRTLGSEALPPKEDVIHDQSSSSDD